MQCNSHCSFVPATQLKDQEKERRVLPNFSKKKLRTPARCPWDTRRDKQGSTSQCPRGFLLFDIKTTDGKAFARFARIPARCPRDTGRHRRLRSFMRFFLMCLFCSLKEIMPLRSIPRDTSLPTPGHSQEREWTAQHLLPNKTSYVKCMQIGSCDAWQSYLSQERVCLDNAVCNEQLHL